MPELFVSPRLRPDLSPCLCQSPLCPACPSQGLCPVGEGTACTVVTLSSWLAFPYRAALLLLIPGSYCRSSRAWSGVPWSLLPRLAVPSSLYPGSQALCRGLTPCFPLLLLADLQSLQEAVVNMQRQTAQLARFPLHALHPKTSLSPSSLNPSAGAGPGVVVLTSRLLYSEELVIHVRVNLNRTRSVLCCMYRLALRLVLCGTFPLAAGQPWPAP